jgi:dihydroxy-acid dehydratase
MACLAEALGLSLPGSAATPAVDARRHNLAEQAGSRIVAMVDEELRPSTVLDRRSFGNAIRVNAAIGGSTNAVIHLLAIAGRAEVPLSLADFESAAGVPLLVNLLPSGEFLMEEFAYAGGLPAVLRELGDLVDLHVPTVTGTTLAQNIADARNWQPEVIRPTMKPVYPPGNHTAVLYGNLAPDGAVIKVSAASGELLEHTGPALVFDTIEDFQSQVDDPALPVEAATVLVVRGAGPRGYPGMPEIGNLAIPRKLLDAGVRDMVRLTDGRMSGTSYGTVVLHVAPESAAGGPLALLRTGDPVTLDVPGRRIDMAVEPEELRRRAGETTEPAFTGGGYTWLYRTHVRQADTGADFDFLAGRRGHAVPRRHL